MSRKSSVPKGRRVRSAPTLLILKHRIADGPLDLQTATEDQLIRAYYADGNKAAREYLVLAIREYANSIADVFFFHRMPEYSLTSREDLRSCAIVGALDAMQRFNLKYNVPFRAWLRNRITGEILDGLRRLQDYPRVIAKNRREVKPLIAKLKHKLHRNPTEDEVCLEFGEDLRSIITDPLFQSGVYNQCRTSRDDGDSDDANVLSQVVDKRCHRPVSVVVDIEKIIHGVFLRADREDLWLVIYGYYFYGLNNSKIANAERCSVSTIVNRHHEALRLLRDSMSREGWEELLK